MFFKGCTVEIPEGREEKINDATYVKIRNGSNFSIKLGTRSQPKIAKIFLQGIEQGEFVLEPYKNYEAIERSICNNKRFVVYDGDTKEAYQMGKDEYDKDDLGLVEVHFYDVKKRVQPLAPYIYYILPDMWTGPCYNDWETPYRKKWTITCGTEKPNLLETRETSDNSCCYNTDTISYNTSIIGTEGITNQSFGYNDKYEIDYSISPTVLYLRLVPEKDKPEKLQTVSKAGWTSAYPKTL